MLKCIASAREGGCETLARKQGWFLQSTKYSGSSSNPVVAKCSSKQRLETANKYRVLVLRGDRERAERVALLWICKLHDLNKDQNDFMGDVLCCLLLERGQGCFPTSCFFAAKRPSSSFESNLRTQQKGAKSVEASQAKGHATHNLFHRDKWFASRPVLVR